MMEFLDYTSDEMKDSKYLDFESEKTIEGKKKIFRQMRKNINVFVSTLEKNHDLAIAYNAVMNETDVDNFVNVVAIFLNNLLKVSDDELKLFDDIMKKQSLILDSGSKFSRT